MLLQPLPPAATAGWCSSSRLEALADFLPDSRALLHPALPGISPEGLGVLREPGDRAEAEGQEDREPFQDEEDLGDRGDGSTEQNGDSEPGVPELGSGGETVLKDGGARVGDGMAT